MAAKTLISVLVCGALASGVTAQEMSVPEGGEMSAERSWQFDLPAAMPRAPTLNGLVVPGFAGTNGPNYIGVPNVPDPEPPGVGVPALPVPVPTAPIPLVPVPVTPQPGSQEAGCVLPSYCQYLPNPSSFPSCRCPQ